MTRRCLECDRPLRPDEQGALCSDCYFAIICDPRNAAELSGVPDVRQQGWSAGSRSPALRPEA